MTRRAMTVLAVLLAAGLSGCVLSRAASKLVGTAVGSVSDASTSSSDRLTADRERDERDYRADLRVATRDLIANGASPDELQRELGRVAELHGISHWEAEPGTLLAIGAGACQADASGAPLEALLERLGVDDRLTAREGCRAAQ